MFQMNIWTYSEMTFFRIKAVRISKKLFYYPIRGIKLQWHFFNIIEECQEFFNVS